MLSAAAATWHVDVNNLTGNEDGSTRNPYRTIQQAVDAAESGDSIRVAVGTYYGSVNSQGKGLNLLGGYRGASSHRYAEEGEGNFEHRSPPPSGTILDGEGLAEFGVIWTRFDDSPYSALLDNFVVRNFQKGVVCDTVESWPQPTEVIIQNNLIEWNGHEDIVSRGAGVIICGDNSAILNNLIRHNQGGRGAGILRVGSGAEPLRIEGNRIENNICRDDHGAGLLLYGEVHLVRNVIAGNRIELTYGWGGGVLMVSTGTLHSEGNCIRNNHAPSYGGGVLVDEGGHAILRNDLIHHNTTDTGHGAGVAVDDGDPGPSGIRLQNCTIVYNNHNAAEVGLGGNGLFLDNQGQGTSIEAENCVFWGNQDDFHVRDSGAVLTLSHCLSEESWPGTNNRNEAPQFLESTGDYRPATGSPLIGGGSVRDWMTDAQDLAGHPRLDSGRADIGAYQWMEQTEPGAFLSAYQLWLNSKDPSLALGIVASPGKLVHLEYSEDLTQWHSWHVVDVPPAGGLLWQLVPLPDTEMLSITVPTQLFARPAP
jgi:hypothetical protein